jgi:Leucine-rich repeat (LRR) protein
LRREYRWWAPRYVGSLEQPLSLATRQATQEEWEALFHPQTGLLRRVAAVILSADQLLDLQWMALLPQSVRQVQVVGDLSQSSAPLAVLNRFSQLEVLKLSSTGLSEVSGVQRLVHLKRLDVSGNALEDMTPLGELSALEVLNLSENAQIQLYSLVPLRLQLQELDVSGTFIEEVSILKSFKGLRKLSLRQTHVSDIDDLRGLEHLESADFSDTWMQSVEALAALPRLQSLNLAFTLVSQLLESSSEVKDLDPAVPVFSELHHLILLHTPIPSSQLHLFRKSHPECLVVDSK